MTADGFKDHFSGHAADYARARPTYPDALFRFLAGLCDTRELALDCATGNGQAAVALSVHFDRVIATDASAEQLAAATPAERVEFREARAEHSGLDAETIDLLTCAQALHWFDIETFFTEARRVLKPRGVLAVWCYGTCRIDAACDRIVHGFYRSLDPWWPPEREVVERGYRDITMPFPLLDAPRFAMQADWRASDMLDYLGTWSATRRCREDTGREPLAAIEPELKRVWGRGTRRVRWPLHFFAGRRD